jgi:hypothetical protein
MKTPSQKGRIAGFKASLAVRGITVKLDGADSTYNALVDETGKAGDQFEVSLDQRHFSNLSILRDSPNLADIQADCVLIEVDEEGEPCGRTFTITDKTEGDIKITYKAVTTYQ